MENKLYAVKKRDKWWAVIDCGPTVERGMTYGGFFNNHFKKDGRTYRYYKELFMPPSNLTEWQEIKTVDKWVTYVVNPGDDYNKFEGWKDEEDACFVVLQNFAQLLNKNLSINDIKAMIDEDNKRMKK